MRDVFDDLLESDVDMCDDYGNEYMKIDDHDEAMQAFKDVGAEILKEMIIAIKRMDTAALNEAIDEMADHLGATI